MAEPFRVPGVTRSTLWGAWKAIRIQLRRLEHRDPVDFLEYDIDPDVWINRLLRQIGAGTYTPHPPKRLTLAKSNGFSRSVTLPSIPDLVLYRTIVDNLFRRARHQQKKHVYFCQATLSKVVSAAFAEAQAEVKETTDGDPVYPVIVRNRFLEWLRYDQYRKLLIFKAVHKFIVLTDISNFFDSILYGRVEQSLYGLKASPKIVGLLFFLLERLSPREAYTPGQRIGLPVDQCDCSRNLAHMILFPHDERMVTLVGEEAYVRWMDDQNIGVGSRAEGLKVLAEVGASLSRLHLTPNAAKSKILTLAQAKRHFHFRANALLDKIDDMPYRTAAEKAAVRKALSSAWRVSLPDENHGEWGKILKRFYRYGARAGARFLRRRATADILGHPSLVSRVCEYVQYTSTIPECIAFARQTLEHPEQVYGDVSYQILDWLLRLEPSMQDARTLRALFQSIAKNQLVFLGAGLAKSLVPIALLRYGDKRSVKSLSGPICQKLDKLSVDQVRSIALVLAGFGDAEFLLIQAAASLLLLNHLSEFVRMVHRIKGMALVPDRFKSRIQLLKDSITFRQFVDMRTLVTLRLLRLNGTAQVQKWVRDKKAAFLASPISDFDKKLLRRTLS